ncbi:MAG: hypothetical protein LBU70_03975, partial [Chitinispirillales bacterium]|nr:hypothetical protein [Chitinispirillales bacterium]
MLKKMLTAMLAIFTTMAVATDFEDDGEGFTNARRVVGLVLVVEFQDMKAIHTLDEVRDFFNRPGGIEGSNSSGSIRDYFYGISNGHMEYTNIVVPVIVTLPHDRAHYNRAGNSISANANVIITDALNILNEMNIDLDLSELTLNPSNGRALAFNIFYAGGSLSRILNHAGSYRGGVTLNGVEFGRYQISNMGTNKNLSARLALVVHENGHSLMGWPHSLLRNRYAEENIRAIWCIMSASYGNAFPQQVNAYFRHLPGWIDVVDITNATPGTEFSMESNSHKAFVYWRNDREGYFIEARRRVKPYNHLFPTGGLAIWHIHKDGREGHDFPRVALVQADGRNDLENRVNTGDTTDLFRLGVNTEFNSSTTPAAIYHDGTPSGISLTNISDTGAVMTFMIGKPHGPTDPLYKFYSRMGSYSTARGHFEIEVSQNLTLNRRLIINTPVAAGTTLTIRSANPSAPAVLTRGIEGDLFTVPNSATLILENIIIDGGGNGDFTETGGGTLVRVNTGGTFIMNTGAVLRNNVNTGDGGGVHVRNGATFTMNGGEISSNTANNHGGGVFATGVGSVLNMIGGKISSNRAGAEGGGVR